MNNIFSNFFKKEKNSLDLTRLQQDLVGWHETGKVNTLSYYKGNQYENGYASIKAIANQFIMIKPYAVDARGKPVQQANVINVLAAPNKSMSGLEFREALAIMSLVHNKVYVRVWYNGNKLTEQSIRGFTFLENVHEFEDKNGTTYQTREGETLTDKEVIVLKDVNPYDLNCGYSAASAAFKWANLDDYIIAYQTGFFENGAVPAGQFIISAPTTQEFNDIVRGLKAKHSGAGKNGNVVYSYAPLDPVTGKPVQSSITWVPFNVMNKDLALKDLLDEVQIKVDSVYGVPSSMRGVVTETTYAAIRIEQEVFIDNTIRPFATKLWTKFTHELNNVIGNWVRGSGLGYMITFDLDTPHIAEEELAKSETQQNETNTLMVLLNAGYTLESAVEALTLPESFLALDKPEAPAPEPIVEEDNPEVDEGGDLEDAPEQEYNKLSPLDINCKQCGRYLMKATGTVVVEDMPCPRCKATNNFKIINPLGDDVTHEFSFEEKSPKDWKYIANSKGLSDEQIAVIQQKVASIMRTQMEHQIDNAQIEINAFGDEEKEAIALYAKQVYDVVVPVVVAEGSKQYILSREIEGIAVDDLTNFSLTDMEAAKYEKYLNDVVTGYSEDTAKAIRTVLKESIGQNLPVQEVKSNLSKIMQTDEWRVQRLALSETNRAGNTGSIAAMEKVARDTRQTINKIWQARNGACEYCRAMHGKEVGIREVFVKKGDEITGEDGGILKNDFGHMDVPIAHSNCGCYTIYKVVKD